MSDQPDVPNGLNLADAMEKLMAHPEIIELAASVLKPDGKADNPPSAPSDSEKSIPDPDSDAVSVNTTVRETKSLSDRRRGGNLDGSIALLIALKPYLSKKRCETIDRLIEFGKIGRVIFNLK